MIGRSRITSMATLGIALLGLLHGSAVTSADGKAYKYVDEKGNVVYSQTPPPAGGGVKKLELQPAYRGLGGSVAPASPYGEGRGYYDDVRQEQYRRAQQQRQQQREDAGNRRRAEIEAECVRNRGTDCSNPETLRYIESTKVPGGRRY